MPPASTLTLSHAHRLNPCPAICLWGLGILLCSASAVATQYHVDVWTTENGLPQNIIRDMCQTPDGYLWLATLDGMARFDGVRFVIFNHSNTPGIGGNRFTSLYCTVNGEFWAGTETNGVTRYSRGKFTTYTARQGLPANDIPAVIGDDAGHIWALSHTSIVQWNETGYQLMELPAPESECNYFPLGRSGFWCIEGNTLHLFIHGQFVHYPLPRAWQHLALARAGQDLSGAIWLTDGSGRFAKLSGGRWSTIPRAHKEQAASSNWADLASTYRDSWGNLWEINIGSDSAAFLLEALSLPLRGQLQRITFNSFFEDREGSIWLTTDGQGLYRLRQQTITTLSTEDGLPDRNVYPVCQDREGVIWIGTWNGGLARFSGGKLIAVPIAGRTSNRISSIFEDRDGVLWVATSEGLYKRQWGHFRPVHNSILDSVGDVRAIYQDPERTLLFGTGQGLLRFNNDTWSLLTTKDGLATNDVRVIIQGRAGNVWIGGYGGLTSLDHGQFKHWTEADGLASNSIRSLYEDRDGVLWIGTYDGGLGRFKDGRFTRCTVREGLFSNGAFRILEDRRGYLWMSCNRGIYRVSKSELNELAIGKRAAVFSAAYGKSEGMRNAECNGGLWPAGIRARDGRLWFPTQDGVAVIDPEAVTTNPLPPPVVIESISLDHELQPLDRATRVPPGSENLELEYTALSFFNSEHIRFRYRLEGLDRAWIEANTRRTAYYSHLPPGDYVFKVIAANSDGVWNTQGKSLSIVVLPPFYRTWWFVALALTGVLVAVILIWRSRVSQLKQAHAVQQAFTRQLIASQEGERKRIAAELHDGLGQQLVVIKNLALISLRDGTPQTASRPQIEEISAQASHALGEVRKISYNLRPYQLDRLGLTKAIQGILKQVSAATTISFTTEIDAIDNVFAKDSEINFYRIVQECINNVVKHSQAATASMAVRRTGNELLLTIQDDGRGFTPSVANSDSDLGGFGLIGISERTQLLGGRLAIRSEPGQGTMISIKIPLSDGHVQ
ncbi:MAG TPA: two-component regulator propeller domain-containing protein [Terriglobales bacterium]